MELSPRETALLALGRELQASGYSFTTATPATHRRVLARAPGPGSSLRDIFGWSRSFEAGALPSTLRTLLRDGGALEECEGRLRSGVRFSTLGDGLYAHSAFPTTAADAVFFGPDTYRFCRAIVSAGLRPRRVADVGCGCGPGGLVAGRDAERIVLADINESALSLARVNAALAGSSAAQTVLSDVLAGVDGDFDLIVANPPYMRDAAGRVYRDGAGRFGEEVSLRMLREALPRLSRGGTLLLYTGSAIVDGADVFRGEALPILEASGASFRYEELDPDVFGEELDQPGYAAVERIAAVLLTVVRSKQ